jgi:hypothetical protein
MMLPGGTGDTPFQRFLVKASVYRDIARSGRPLRPGMEGYLIAMSNGPHEGGCVTRLFDDAFARIKL